MSHFKKPPTFDRDLLVDLGGWTALKEAKKLVSNNLVESSKWEDTTLRGNVKFGSRSFHPSLNLKSTVFVDAKCNCRQGQNGQVCQHVLAICLHYEATKAKVILVEQTQKKKLKSEDSKPKEVQTLVLTPDTGQSIELNVLLPPNLKQTAKSDAIMIKLMFSVDGKRLNVNEVNQSKSYKCFPQVYQAIALVESWCEGKFLPMLQINSKQMLELCSVLSGSSAFFWLKDDSTPIAWVNGKLDRVHAFIQKESSVSKESVSADGGSIKSNRESKGALKIDGSMNFVSVQLPPKSHTAYSEIYDILKFESFKSEPSNGKWWLRDRRKTLNFIANYKRSLETMIKVVYSKNFLKQTKDLIFAEVTADVSKRKRGFNVEVAIIAEGFDSVDIQRSISMGQNFIEESGKLCLLPADVVDRAETLQQSITGNVKQRSSAGFKQYIGAHQINDAEDLFAENLENWNPPEIWKEKSLSFRDVTSLPFPNINKDLITALRPYQKLGVAWLTHLYKHEMGGILADEMGLGKTIQALAFMSALKSEKEESSTFLVVCPASLVENWKREANTFAKELKVYIHHGLKRLKSEVEFLKHDLIITSYVTLANDLTLFKKITFDAIIGDEAQHIKNKKTKNARALMTLKSAGRFLLTGTPIENSLDDLRGLFEFLMPGYLVKTPSSLSRDEKDWYDTRNKQQAASYILRRTKLEVAPELPGKIEKVLYCKMSESQESLYKSIQEKAQREIFEMEMAGASMGRIKMAGFTQLLRLRQICAEPRVVDPEKSANDSAKLKAFMEILNESIDGGHRILLFSQFVKVLGFVKEALEDEGISYSYLDGKTKNRLSVCDNFNNDSSIPVFLISTKAGGVGLNLTGADTIVHYDPWWNPAIEAQATDRAHRIGQTKVVTSIKLITTNSVEEKVLDLQKRKYALLEDLLDASNEASSKIGLDEIKAILD